MARVGEIDNMARAIRERTHPSVTLWNRIEVRPRLANFERALGAELRDALWMLTRQWQTGEFQGEDAGSPIVVRTLLETTPLTRFRAGDAAPAPLDRSVPLEAQVEARPMVLDIGPDKVGLDVRIVMGHRWLKLIDGLYAVDLFLERYRFRRPDPAQRDEAGICAHPQALQSFAAVAGKRAIDGFALYMNLKAGTYDLLQPLLPAEEARVDGAARAFTAWVERTWMRADGNENPAWNPSRFEYRFAAAAPASPGETRIVADEYNARHLDWYAFDHISGGPPLGAAGNPTFTTLTTLPTPVTYAGMPHPRWWTMEDGRTNLGAIQPDTTDLAKLLFMEFGLVYSNDWFLTPLTVPAGSLLAVSGVLVTNVFGDRFLIEAIDAASQEERQRFSLFTLTSRDAASAPAPVLFVAPAAAKVQESAPFEAAALIRDEMANMVWGIERTVMAPQGRGMPGAEAAREVRAYHARFVAPPPAAAPGGAAALDEVPIRYELMTEVPEHWIPFVGATEGRLQRGTMLRIIRGDDRPPAKIRPRTTLLRPGLDRGAGYFVPQEEVPRAGAVVLQTFRRTRAADGRVLTWMASHKQTGRGEGWSGLAFDRIVSKRETS
jgi:hypothetical protein